MKNKGRGNVVAQRKRRKKRMKELPKVPKTKKTYITIDGNITNHPCAFCKHYNGVLTVNLINTHQCRQRECKMLVEGERFD